MAPVTNSENFKFIVSCMRHTNNDGKVNFDEVAKECSVVTKGAAAKRYKRLMKAHNIQQSPSPVHDPSVRPHRPELEANIPRKHKPGQSSDANTKTSSNDECSEKVKKRHLDPSSESDASDNIVIDDELLNEAKKRKLDQLSDTDGDTEIEDECPQEVKKRKLDHSSDTNRNTSKKDEEYLSMARKRKLVQLSDADNNAANGDECPENVQAISVRK
ncbi:hypothetical protein MMC12_008627 [Toensbergia leucococca]|nr:hypothetical protein [Toensbergia leucococca]